MEASKAQPLEVGQEAPEVSFRTVEGEDVTLEAAADGGPVALVFYRGGWCPYCNRHLMELRTVEKELRERGWSILAVSPDRPEKLAATAKDLKTEYTLLSDSDMSAARAFGLAFEVDAATREKYKEYGIDLEKASGDTHHQLPVPSVFLIDADGVIQYVYSNPDYKVRLSAEKLTEAVKGLGEE